MSPIRRWLLHQARPRTLNELSELLPDSVIEAVGTRCEAVVYTGWLCSKTPDRRLLPMLSEDAIATPDPTRMTNAGL